MYERERRPTNEVEYHLVPRLVKMTLINIMWHWTVEYHQKFEETNYNRYRSMKSTRKPHPRFLLGQVASVTAAVCLSICTRSRTSKLNSGAEKLYFVICWLVIVLHILMFYSLFYTYSARHSSVLLFLRCASLKVPI